MAENFKIIERYSVSINNYLNHLGYTQQYVEKTIKDNICYFLGEMMVFSVRIDMDNTNFFQSYKHIDFYSVDSKRPFKRVFLNDNEEIMFERYYELDTWKKNYEVYLNQDNTAQYTIDYTLPKDEQMLSWDDTHSIK